MDLPGSPERRVWTVSDLVNASRDLLEEALPFVWVRGEISGFSAPASGHWYFDLKDDRSLVAAAMFSRANALVPFAPEEGMELIVGGTVTIYPARGKYQIIAEVLEPVGWGALQVAYEQLKERLDAEGLFGEARKRRLPLLPRCVGVVTSPSGAAWRDMRRVWDKNEVPIRVILAPAQVQGPGSAEAIGGAIEALNRHGGADVLIVGRGGGSREDLWAFNEEAVVRAVAGSRIPVVSAVGHEIDHTLADLAADARAATPTAAAELVAASREALLGRAEAAHRRARSTVSQRILSARGRLGEPRLQRSLRQPSRLLTVYRQRLDDALTAVETPVAVALDRRRRSLAEAGRALTARNLTAVALQRRARLSAAAQRLTTAVRRALEAREARTTAAVGRIEALSPLAVLSRGYAICEHADRRTIVRRAADVSVGDRVSVRLSRDSLECRVEAAFGATEPGS